MRLWTTLHPRHLDPQGLVALWREALLAQAVLGGRTRGYTRHPQLQRFAEHAAPLDAVGAYLTAVAEEASARGYRWSTSKIDRQPLGASRAITATTGQIEHEWRHLGAKLAARATPTARVGSLPASRRHAAVQRGAWPGAGLGAPVKRVTHDPATCCTTTTGANPASSSKPSRARTAAWRWSPRAPGGRRPTSVRCYCLCGSLR